MTNKDIDDVFGHVISTYSRAKAIENGGLIDVSNVGRKLGFTIPIAVTNKVWTNCIKWTEESWEQEIYQNSRIWCVLSRLHFTIRKCPETSCIQFKLSAVPRKEKTKKAQLITLKAMIGAGDEGLPVITIMLPNEEPCFESQFI